MLSSRKMRVISITHQKKWSLQQGEIRRNSKLGDKDLIIIWYVEYAIKIEEHKDYLQRILYEW